MCFKNTVTLKNTVNTPCSLEWAMFTKTLETTSYLQVCLVSLMYQKLNIWPWNISELFYRTSIKERYPSKFFFFFLSCKSSEKRKMQTRLKWIEFQIQRVRKQISKSAPRLTTYVDVRRKQQRRCDQLLASNWENLCLLRNTVWWVLLHLIKPQPDQSWEKAKRDGRKALWVCLCTNIFSNWKIAFLYLLLFEFVFLHCK